MKGTSDYHHDLATTVAYGRQPMRYPTNHLLGVVDTREETTALDSALTTGGFFASEIEIRSGVQDADELRASTGRAGLAGLLLRVAERIGAADEELETKHRYEQAMRDGRFVVVVAAPTNERKERATRIFRAHGAYTIVFLGKHTIEYIA